PAWLEQQGAGFSMPEYIFRAVDTAGTFQQGELVSPSRAGAVEALDRRGWIPIDVHERAAGSRNSVAPNSRRIAWHSLLARRRRLMSRRQLLAFTDSLAALVRAGLTIDRSLHLCTTLATGPAAER